MLRRALLPLLLLACDSGPEAPAPDAAPPADARASDQGADRGPERPDAGPQDPCEPGDLVAHPVGGWTVATSAATGVWRITPPHGGGPVLASPCAGPAWRAAAGAPFVRALFGAFDIELEGPRSGLVWSPGEGLALVIGDGAAPEGPHLRFSAAEHGGLRLRLEAPGSDAVALRWRCGADEGFFGLGTQVIGPDLRGHRFPLWTQEQGINKGPRAGFPLGNTLEAAYAPMGVWHSSAGFAAVIDHDGYSALDLCAADAQGVELQTYADHTGFVLVPGAGPRERMAGITAWTGRPPAVPAWTFAPWNDAVGGPDRLREVATRLRAEGVPSSAIWSEDWIGGEQTATGFRLTYAWEWDPGTYPELPEDIAWLHAQGFAFLAYFNTFVPSPTRMFAEGLAGDFLVKDAAGSVITFQDPAFRDAALVDLSHPEAWEWMSAYKRRATAELGVDGWMADFSEWLPVEARMADGRSGWEAHNRYPLDYQRLNRAAFEAANDRPAGWLFFSRSGWASTTGGVSGLAPVLWAGDQNTDWDRDDGFPTVIPIGLNAGLAGAAYYGSDVAGYTSVRNPNTTKELFYRWTSQAALTPVMRTHHGSDKCGNWAFDRDAETTAHFRRWAAIHVLLYRYFEQLAAEAQATGLPLMRHPILVEAAEGQWRDAPDQYFLGDDLLVAPVVVEGASERAVHLPGPGWWPLLGGAPLAEARPTVAAPPTELPVFVRPGTALPLLPAVVDSFYGASAPGITDLRAVAGDTRVALYPDATGAASGAWRDRLLTVEGLTAAPDWPAATLGGAPVPGCAEAPEAPACHAPEGLVLRPAGVVELRLGEARIRLDAPDGIWRLAYAGAAFGPWAAPTVLTDLNPDIPPPCAD